MVWRGLEGRFGDGQHYALPRNVPQKAVLTEVRFKAREYMCPRRAWKVYSVMGGVTHFREKCHRRRFGRKCVAGREEESALEGPRG